MLTISDLSRDLVEEILSRVPITSLRSVRSTCKRWNQFSKDPSFTKKHYGKETKEILVIMTYDLMACLMSVNLHGNHKDLVDPSIKQIGKLNQVKIFNMCHCDGLLLFVTKNNSRVMVWNPYLGQTRWIQPRNDYHIDDNKFALGYDSNNNNHKILRFNRSLRDHIVYEIYDFKSNSWRVLDITTDWRIIRWRGVSVKRNTYLIAQKKLKEEEVNMEEFLICFDFTSERFGQCLPLPFQSCGEDFVLLSSVREEKLAVLFKKCDAYEIEIWITTTIEPNEVLWSKFLKVNMSKFTETFLFPSLFFVEEKKKVALICEIDGEPQTNNKAYTVGENIYYREVDLRKSNGNIFICSYLPSSVQIQ